ncbi:uncharacterized protein LOC127788212 [Diospyros lotus]|uniref:uncharacterized protein LOC127788212 n=1 Tax=Diospyros lotus TaxID=55363 RepID=UPI00225822AA|nr:uncharacterized protein LOC127788212 [Diospyros lotus]
MGACESLIADFKYSMMDKFEMSDLGLLHYFLGLEVNQSAYGIFISQRKYATDLLKRFNMLNCKLAFTPINVNEKLAIDDGTGAISWSSKKQEIVTLSSSKAEYVAATALACQAVWLIRLLTNLLDQEQAATTEIFCDNRATIAMIKNPTFHSRTKHIDIRYHYIH